MAVWASLLVAVALQAQVQTQTTTDRQALPQRPAPLGAPARDARPVVTGTASVRGRVFASDTGKPLRRARITIQGPELRGEPRTTSTNADGRFEVKDLPAGRYTMTANRSGYLQLRYGQRRPFEQGKELQLSDRQAIDNVDFTLPRMSLITGRVFDEAGEPIAGVRVMAYRTAYFEGRRRLVPVFGPMANTDDAGQFRILGLSPGSYFVTADTRETWTVTDGGSETVMGYANTYFPGVTALSDARRITVGIAQEIGNQDFALVPGRAASISGTVLDSLGRPVGARQVSLSQEFRGPGNAMVMMSPGATTAADGTFTVKSVPPGEYKLVVRFANERDGVTVQESAAALVTVTGADVTNVTLMTSSGWSFSGRIATDTGELPATARDRFRVNGRPVNGDNSVPGGPGPGPSDSGRVKDDWTYVVTNLNGPVRIRVTVPEDWLVQSIRQGARDFTDGEVDARNGETLDNVEIVVSQKAASVSGVLADDKGAPVLDGTVIVFASDSSKWSEDSRFVRAVRPDQEGKYQIRGLPPAEYLAVAVDYVEDGMWNDPEYLETLRAAAQRFSLRESESRPLSLSIVKP